MPRKKRLLDTLKLPRRPSISSIETPHIFTRGPKVLQAALFGTKQTDSPGDVPSWLVATKPEWYCYWALNRLGKREGVDFDFQSSLIGGRLQLGGLVVDFLFVDPPNLAINIQGVYWHYGMGADRHAKDVMQREQLARLGIQVIYIDEDNILANPIYYVKEALAGRDHSRMEGK